ncbi:hypothetical protein PTTG_30020 [Puccinia triticina 1-1 BBBD Race 1]|uniref:Uncharacterized protein n=1 Tax=Puccinia triticina (isolate 1-1 / race 1 (BBBD)) TaxID=630390 RepID=A0A180G304_PUCT1|nr:hypothetical protein PTTG_30020 [Puccinia triticina 1-1 BBBD Race 1]
MAETSQQNCATATALAQPPKNGFEGLEAALPPLQEDFLKLPEEEPLPPDTMIPPALYQPRETSIALASNRSTPVPRPIDREQIDLTVNPPQTSQPPSQPINPEGMRPTAPPSLALLPYTQSPRREASSGPMDLIPEEEELSSLISMFNEQFDLFVRAREAQNISTMRRLLSQASMTQEMIIDLVGRNDGIRLCQDWIPREEHNNLEVSLTHQNNGNVPPNSTALQFRTPLQLAMIPHANQWPLIVTPTPEPTDFQHRALAQEFQVPTLSNPPEPCPQPQSQLRPENQNYQGSPLPPPPPPQTLQVRPPPASIPREVVQLFRPSPHHPTGGYNPHLYPQMPQEFAGHNPPHPQNNWRGSGRNWRRPQDNTQRVLEIGEYLMRATRGVRRGYGQGRARGRGPY